jgi:hypothetical protein
MLKGEVEVIRTVEPKTMLRTAVAVGAALIAVLALPIPAWAANDCVNAAADPTAAQYCNPTQNAVSGAGEERSQAGEERSQATVPVAQEGGGGPGPGAEPTASSPGSLPFTGSDLLVLAAVAIGFAAIGLTLRQVSGSRPSAE